MIRKLFPLKTVKPPKNTLYGELNSVYEWCNGEFKYICVEPVSRFGFRMFKATVATQSDYLYDPDSSFGFSRFGWTEQQARDRVKSALEMWERNLESWKQARPRAERL